MAQFQTRAAAFAGLESPAPLSFPVAATPAEEPKPAPTAVRYVDAAPTWAAILPALLAVVTDGTAEGQRIARAELARMARAADSAIEMERHMADDRMAAYHATARAAGI